MIKEFVFPQSSLIAYGLYDTDKYTLSLILKSSAPPYKVYKYNEVTEKEIEDMLDAPSVGKFYNQVIKKKPCTKGDSIQALPVDMI